MTTTPPTPGNVFGKAIHQGTIDGALLTGPGEDLVAKLLMQLSSVQGFVTLFGPYTPQQPGKNTQPANQRWADYDREDWSLRQLPAINVYEAETEDKESDQAYLRGTINIQVFWPPSARRSDWARVPTAFKAALENFFASKYVRDMLDEIYWHQRPMKVDGLNELGRTLTWSPNAEDMIESEEVPVTLVSVRYRIDLRAWYRALEYMNRTKADPFEVSLANLANLTGTIAGVTDPQGENVVVEIQESITVSNPTTG